MQSSINERDCQSGRVKHSVNPTTTPFPIDNSAFPFTFQTNQENQLMETSFQESLTKDHAQFVWRASLKFLKNSLQIEINEERGFNDEQIFEPVLQQRRSLSERKQITEVIVEISFLSYDQKQKMLLVLNFSSNLKKLFKRLSGMFDLQIMKELMFVLLCVWQKYTTFKLSKKYSSELSLLIFPAYHSLNMQIIENQPSKQTEYFEESTEKQILDVADEAGTEIAANLFIDSKLRYINLKEAQVVSKDSNSVRRQFQLFMQAIARTIFLCIEGYFCQLDEQLPSSERVEKSKSFFDQFQQNMNQGKKRKNI